MGPIFRSVPPSSTATRTFPRLDDLLAGTTTPGEVLPTAGRLRPNALTLKLIARDADPRGGGWGIDEMEVEIDSSSGPFEVTYPNGGESLTSTALTVLWNVAGTDVAPVSCAEVDVELSTNGGSSFDVVLLAQTPNDGSVGVQLPAITTSAARLRLRCSDNIFFDVSNGDFTLTLSDLPFDDGFETGDTSRWTTVP